MGAIRLSRPGNRGVSLLVLIFAVTVLSVFGVGLALVMSAKFRSFPYVMSSHQAQALADAGIEFGIRYISENRTGFSSNPTAYIPSAAYKSYSFGDGRFELKYLSGCPATLYSKGVCGGAVREVRLVNVDAFAGGTPNSTPIVPTFDPGGQYQSSPYNQYSRLAFTTCNGDDAGGAAPGNRMVRRVRIATNQPYGLNRFGFGEGASAGSIKWQWDHWCDAAPFSIPWPTSLALDQWPAAPNGTPTWTREWVYDFPGDCTDYTTFPCHEMNVIWQPNPEGKRKDVQPPTLDWYYCPLNPGMDHASPYINTLDPRWQFEFSTGSPIPGDNWFWIEVWVSVNISDPPNTWEKIVWKMNFTK